jgi:hypothetical protein
MKYALLVYGTRETLDGERRAVHNPATYRALDTGGARLLAHYRLRAPERTTTIRVSDGNPTRSTGPATEHRETLCALFLIDGDQEETVLEIAAQLPAVRNGAIVEVWPLIETRTLDEQFGGQRAQGAERHALHARDRRSAPTADGGRMSEAINLVEKLGLFDEHWQPKIVASSTTTTCASSR